MKSQSWFGRRLDGSTRQKKSKPAPLTLHALSDRSGPSSLLADAASLDWISTPTVAWTDASTMEVCEPAASRQVKAAQSPPIAGSMPVELVAEGIDEAIPSERVESSNDNWLIADRSSIVPVHPTATSPTTPTSPGESSAAQQPQPNRIVQPVDNASVRPSANAATPISLDDSAELPEPPVDRDASSPVEADPEKPGVSDSSSNDLLRDASSELDLASSSRGASFQLASSSSVGSLTTSAPDPSLDAGLPELEITVEPSTEFEQITPPTWGEIFDQPIDGGVVGDAMVGPAVGLPNEYPDRAGEPTPLLPGSVGFGGEEQPTTSQNRDGATDGSESSAGPRSTKSTTSSASGLAEGSFRLGRGDSGTGEVAVVFKLQGLSGNSIETTERSATIPSGAQSVRVSPGLNAQGQPYEVAVLTVLSINGVAVSRPPVTLFQQGKPAACSEQALYEAFRQAGSQEAFAALVQRHRPGVFRASYQVLGNWADAEDVSQIVFLAFAQQQLKFNTTVQGWLQKAARNAAIALLRAKARRTRHEREAALPEIGRAGDNQHELREVLLAAMKEIAPPVREAVRLRYMEGRSQHEAAEIVGVPRGTISQRASQGVRELRDVLEQKGAFAG